MTLLLLAALVARCGQNQLILAAPKKKTIEVLLLIYLCEAVVARVFGVWMERCCGNIMSANKGESYYYYFMSPF
jgi:hypothetical protein